VAFVAAALLGLANHKAVVAIGGMVLGGVLYQGLKRQWRQAIHSALASPVAWGFAAGTGVFWAYGLSVAPSAFIQDHLLHHIVDRVRHVDALHYVRPGVYPGVEDLWWRYVVDAGVALPAVGVGALVWLVLRGAGRSRPVLVLALWGVAVSAAFSWVDWRQTKHLIQLMPVLVLAPAAAAGEASRLGRVAWAGLLVVASAAAGYLAYDWIARGFAAFSPFGLTPAGGW
jgi:hypothetical protein